MYRLYKVLYEDLMNVLLLFLFSILRWQYWTADLFVLGNKWKLNRVSNSLEISFDFTIPWKSHPLRLPPRMIRYGKIWVEEVDFFRNNETLKIDGGPFVTEPIVTSYNVPSQGSEKCTMGGKDERELGGKSTFEERNRRYYGFHLSLSIGHCPRTIY